MSFFANASNINIFGGEFNDIKGNLTAFDHSRHETNIDSGNTYNNKIIDAYNNNSKRISGLDSRSRLLHDVEGGGDRLRAPPSPAEDRTAGPPNPRRPQFMPPQTPSEGDQVINIDAFNRTNNQIDNVFNDNSETYRYGRGPTTNKSRGVGRKSIHEEDLQSNSGSPGSGQNKAAAQPSFLAGLPRHMESGVGSGPFMTVDSPQIQHMGRGMRRNFEKLMKYTREQTESMIPGNNNEKDDSDDADSDSSHNTGAENSITPAMNKLSINDNRDHLSPPLISRNKSDPQFPMQLTTSRVPGQSGSSSPSGNLSPYNNALQSHSNPSLAPHMKEQSMVNFLTQPAAVQQVDIRRNNNASGPPTVSTSGFNFPPPSSGGPVFRTINGDFTKYDTTVHRTNINSFNTEENTIQNAFNDNSLVVESLEKKKKKKKIDNTIQNEDSVVDSSEKQKKGKTIENTIPNDNSVVDYSEKQWKGKKIENTILNDNSVIDSPEKQKGKKILGLFAKK